MNRLVVVMLLSVIVLAGCQSEPSRSHASAVGATANAGDTEKAILDLLEQYRQALLKNDQKALDRIWSDDLTFVNFRGDLLTKAQRLANLRSGATAFKSIEISDQAVRTYGDAAVATLRVGLQATYSGQEGSGDYRVTTVWARPKGQWQMVAVHMTRIA